MKHYNSPAQSIIGEKKTWYFYTNIHMPLATLKSAIIPPTANERTSARREAELGVLLLFPVPELLAPLDEAVPVCAAVGTGTEDGVNVEAGVALRHEAAAASAAAREEGAAL